MTRLKRCYAIESSHGLFLCEHWDGFAWTSESHKAKQFEGLRQVRTFIKDHVGGEATVVRLSRAQMALPAEAGAPRWR